MKTSRSCLAALLFLLACSPREQSPVAVGEDQERLWQGLYSGSLPCADCSHTEVNLELLPQNFYRLSIKKIGSITTPAKISQGNFFWLGDGLIRLDERGENMVFFVADDGSLQMRGNDGKAHPDHEGNICRLHKR